MELKSKLNKCLRLIQNFYTKDEIKNIIQNKADIQKLLKYQYNFDGHEDWSLKEAIENKINKGDVYTRDWIDHLLTIYADKSWVQDYYYDKDAVAEIVTSLRTSINLKADKTEAYLIDSYYVLDGVLQTLKQAIESKANLTITNDLQNQINNKADAATTYNKTEVDTALAAKANNTDVYTITAVNNLLADKADKTDVDTALATKADSSSVYTTTQTDNLLSAKADVATTYNKTEIDASLAAKADKLRVQGTNVQPYDIQIYGMDTLGYDCYELMTPDNKSYLLGFTEQSEQTKIYSIFGSDISYTFYLNDTISSYKLIVNETDVIQLDKINQTSYQGSGYTLDLYDEHTTYIEDAIQKINIVLGTILTELKTDRLQMFSSEISANAGLWHSMIDKLQNDMLLKANTADVYQKLIIDNLLAAKADSNNVYTITQTNNLLANKADTATTYSKTNVDNLLANKADAATTYSKTDVDTALAAKADSNSVYTTTQTDNLLAAKANTTAVGTVTSHYINQPDTDYTAQTNLQDQLNAIMDVLGTGYTQGVDNRISIQNQTNLKSILTYLDKLIFTGTSSDNANFDQIYYYLYDGSKAQSHQYNIINALNILSACTFRVQEHIGNGKPDINKYTSPSGKGNYGANKEINTNITRINTELGKIMDELINLNQSNTTVRDMTVSEFLTYYSTLPVQNGNVHVKNIHITSGEFTTTNNCLTNLPSGCNKVVFQNFTTQTSLQYMFYKTSDTETTLTIEIDIKEINVKNTFYGSFSNDSRGTYNLNISFPNLITIQGSSCMRDTFWNHQYGTYNLVANFPKLQQIINTEGALNNTFNNQGPSYTLNLSMPELTTILGEQAQTNYNFLNIFLLGNGIYNFNRVYLPKLINIQKNMASMAGDINYFIAGTKNWVCLNNDLFTIDSSNKLNITFTYQTTTQQITQMHYVLKQIPVNTSNTLLFLGPSDYALTQADYQKLQYYSDILDGQQQYDIIQLQSNTMQKQTKLSLITVGANTTLLDVIYPIGSLYWSSNSTSPATLFGGTWTQIKDKFILAAGDTYTQGSTGGAKSYSLTENNIPQHNHSFTPSGTVSSHTHGFTPSGTVSSHNHSFTPAGTVANHNHSFTPAGTVSSHDHSFSGSQSHYHRFLVYNGGKKSISNCYAGALLASNCGYGNDKKYANAPWYEKGTEHINDPYVESTTVTISGTTGGTQPTFTGTAGTTDNKQPSFTGTAGTTGNKQPTFTGTAGTTGGTQPTFTGTAGTTGNYGKSSVTAVSTMPPYEVYYCWKRTA